MFSVIGNVVACVCWGAVISLVICVLFFLCIRLFYPQYSFSIASGFSLAVLAIFLFIQSFLLVGANSVKDYTEGIGNVTLSVISDTRADMETIRDAIVSEYPIVKKYVEGLESFQGVALNANPVQIAEAVVDGVNREINAYIWSRVFWMSGACVLMIVGFCLLITPGRDTGRACSSREARRTPRSRSTGIRHSRSSSRYR